LNQDEHEERHQQGKHVGGDPLADDGRDQIVNALNQALDDGLALGRHQLRFPNGEPDDNDQRPGDDPTRDHAVGDRKGPDFEKRLSHRRNAM
jgi:hypothetical protein